MNRGMKRVLLGSTAIVGLGLLLPAPVFAAEPVSLSLGGNVTFEAWIVDQDDTTDRGRGYFLETDDANLNWTAKGEADNGLKYTGQLELEMDSGDGDAGIDEIWIRFQGAWGQIEIGDQDGAEDVMLHDGTAALLATGQHDGGAGSVFNFEGASITSPDLVGDTGDDTKISYFTPRINSVQLGVSFTPDSNQNFNATLADGAANSFEESIGFGINVVTSFDDVNVNLAWVAVISDDQAGDRVGHESWALGGNISFGGFVIGASHADMGNSGLTSAAEGAGSDAGEYWEIGASYSAGDYGVAVGYFHGEASNAAGTTDDEVDFFSLAATYNVAPGLRIYAEFDDIDVDQPGTGAGNDNDGQLFMIGTNFSF